MVPETYNLISF